ncbi:MAG: PQQ-dependent dehydrogenase, methanol/ethanol family [Nevskiaceae bacterium]|jgi:PQQ-dependent dehydrogenase (methanol/ethanol family)|nr:PQQ-dependent dehydrogenase, methanol/ethanol family [Nevskiaceae bacterium]
MRRILFGLIIAAVVTACSQSGSNTTGATGASGAAAMPVKHDPNDAEWTEHGGGTDEQRYSALTQVNADNVGQLGLAWFAEIAERGGYQSTPLIIDGMLYMTAPWSSLYAFDAQTGKQLWKVDPQAPREIAATSICCNISNRGAAYADGKIIWGTIDGRLMAVDAKTGAQVWETRIADPAQQYSITGAPRIGDGLVYIGIGGAEFYTRGFIVAHDVKTGKEVWKFYTVPGDPAKGPDGAASDDVMAMAAKTWNGKWWEKGGGGSTWDGIVYDPQSSTVIFGTGNGLPWPAALRSPGGGDNLFTASIVAVDAKTGKYKWHYQATPMDSFDFDNTSPLTLADITIDGQPKRVVMQAPKNGVFYVIEAATGKVQSADPYVPEINWATGFDKANNFKPILNPAADYGKTGKGFYVLPSQAHVWHSQSYNPQTGLIYVPMRRGVGSFFAEEGGRILGNQMVDVSMGKPPVGQTRPEVKNPGAFLIAWDPVARKIVWEQSEGSGSAGTLTTAGNLVFQGAPGQKVAAFRADSGDKVWEASTQGNVVPGPVTYTINGDQYIAVISSASTGFAAAAGKNRLLVYKLNGTAQLPPAAPPVELVLNPPADFGDEATRTRGEDLYQRNCTGCHEGGRMFSGFPDLNYTVALNDPGLFKGIVVDGALAENGMISFKNALNEQDAEAIRSFLTARANELKRNPPRQGGRGGAAAAPAPAAAPAAPATAPAAAPAAHQ